MISVFTERYFQTDYNYISSLNVVIIANFNSIQIFRKRFKSYFKQVLLFKILEVFDKIRNIFLIRKMTKK